MMQSSRVRLTSALVFATTLATGPIAFGTAPPATTPGPQAAAPAPAAKITPGGTPPTPAPTAKIAPGATPPAPAIPLPPARATDAILADIVAALGGAPALSRHRSLHTKMEITFKGLGITGTAEHYGAAGDKALTTTSIPNLASTREGSDGTRFWTEDPINGLRLLEGPEADQARIEVAWNGELRMKELFAKIEAKNELGDDEKPLECLILTPKSGPAMTQCFDAKTHLMAVQRGVRSGPQGDMPFTARLSDWRQVGDIKVAHSTEMQVGPLAFTGRVTSVELDVPVDAALFAVPAAAKGAAGAAAAGKGKARPTKAPRTPSKKADPAAPSTAPTAAPSPPAAASPPADKR